MHGYLGRQLSYESCPNTSVLCTDDHSIVCSIPNCSVAPGQCGATSKWSDHSQDHPTWSFGYLYCVITSQMPNSRKRDCCSLPGGDVDAGSGYYCNFTSVEAAASTLAKKYTSFGGMAEYQRRGPGSFELIIHVPKEDTTGLELASPRNHLLTGSHGSRASATPCRNASGGCGRK